MRSGSVHDILPARQLLPLGLQHVLAMYAGAVVVPLIIAGAMRLSSTETAYLIAADLFTCGIATLLQSMGIGPYIGARLPAVMGCSFIAVGPMVAIGASAGMAGIYGSIIISGALVLVLAPVFGRLARFFPPVVTGSVVTLIGLSLIPVAIKNVGGGAAAADFGDPRHLALAALTLAFIVASERFLVGFLRSVSVLIGIIAGTCVAGAMGVVDLGEVARADWAQVVGPFYFGPPTFVPSGVATMMLVAVVCMIESTGVFLGLGRICEVDVTERDITRGFRAEGLAQLLGGVFNAFPYTTFSQNVGLVAITRVRSRYVVVTAGVILVALGLSPKFAALALVIPPAVLGGAMLAMFGMVAVSGMRILSSVDLGDTSHMLIVACSIGAGLGVTVAPDVLARLPEAMRLFLHSGIVTGSLLAVGLNLILRPRAADSPRS